MKTEIVCVIDRSGSMEYVVSDAIGGFNNFISEQQAIPGEAKLTLVLFDDQYEVVHDRIDLQSVPKLTSSLYFARGMTAMFDAIGKAIDNIGIQLTNDPEPVDKVIFVILTDGVENASLEYTKEKIAEMIKHQETVYSWEFIFLAANQDAFAVGAGLNIKGSNTMNYVGTADGTRAAYSSVSNMTSSHRGS